MAVQIRNLSAALGAEVADIDLSGALPQADIGAIEAAWRERLNTPDGIAGIEGAGRQD